MNALTFPAATLLMALGLVHIDGTSQPEANPSIVHAFGGQALKIDLVVEPLKVNLSEPLEVHADLFQKGQSLLAPIQKDILVAKASQFEGCFQSNQPYVLPLVPWTLPVPKVTGVAEMLARLRTKSGTGEWRPAGQILIKVYPSGFAHEPLAALAKERGLHLFGENKRLREFLQAQKVPFTNEGEGLAALASRSGDKGIYLGEATSRDFADWLASHPGWSRNMAVFCSDSALLPGVFVNEQNGFRLVKVTLPLLDTLSNDPRSQTTLIEILNTLATRNDNQTNL